MEKISVFAPATVANVACGFDIFGFAVDSPGDVVELTRRDTPGVRITDIIGDGGRLPREAARNTAGISIQRFLQHIDRTDIGVDVLLTKQMPLGSGLGSSAASAVAGVFAINELLGRPLQTIELLPFAMEGERIACGSAHADNVGPSLLGGFVVVRSYSPLDVIKLDTPAGMFATLVHPDIEVNTKDARFILKNEVSLKNAITQMGNVAGLVAGLLKPDYDLISRSMVDVIIEPVRSILIPQFGEVKQAALDSGALGCSISGSGPSMFALCRDLATAERVGQAMQQAFLAVGITSEAYVSEINRQGPRVIG
ncbi:homoserine kinase [Rudanella paleaurantiibacter]|uniref:Homoserine kinase n=1 Tax=Rudanella paleaurantiibacter TaxID=2614655 RepID=A0A7J5TTX4_9BACT|nr:homoserine kinase [Rudanella paleaurantiibacter]KAB7727022.1 homoserine kinase [Rudanella paleaurantiibacter]